MHVAKHPMNEGHIRCNHLWLGLWVLMYSFLPFRPLYWLPALLPASSQPPLSSQAVVLAAVVAHPVYQMMVRVAAQWLELGC